MQVNITFKKILFEITISFIVIYSFLALVNCFTILYFNFSDDFFYYSNYQNNKEFRTKSFNFFLFCKLVPILTFLCLSFWIKKILNTNWRIFIVSSLIAIIIFRFLNNYISSFFIIFNNHIINILFNTLFNIIVLLIFLKFRFKIKLALQSLNKSH